MIEVEDNKINMLKFDPNNPHIEYHDKNVNSVNTNENM